MPVVDLLVVVHRFRATDGADADEEQRQAKVRRGRFGRSPASDESKYTLPGTAK